MLDAHYVDRRLVRTYDTLSPPAADTAFYVKLAGRPPTTVLDLGCGTGRLALRLADAGHDVTGVDPAAAMLEVARESDVDERVRWIEGDARSLVLPSTFDLIVMTGHAFQVLLDDTDVAAMLDGAGRHLREGGTLAFESRNPEARGWEAWVPEDERHVEVDGLGGVVYSRRVTNVGSQLVSFEATYRFVETGENVVVGSTLRFMDETTLRSHLDDAGFDQVTIYGDWDGSPVSPSAPELIVVASRSPVVARESSGDGGHG